MIGDLNFLNGSGFSPLLGNSSGLISPLSSSSETPFALTAPAGGTCMRASSSATTPLPHRPCRHAAPLLGEADGPHRRLRGRWVAESRAAPPLHLPLRCRLPPRRLKARVQALRHGSGRRGGRGGAWGAWGRIPRGRSSPEPAGVGAGGGKEVMGR